MAESKDADREPAESTATTTRVTAGPDGVTVTETETPKPQQTETAEAQQAETPKAQQTETPKPQQTETPKDQQTETPKDQPQSPGPWMLAQKTFSLKSYDDDVQQVARTGLTALIVGLLVTAIGAGLEEWRWVQAMLWAGACSAIGWVIGFLFGVPRTLQSEGQAEVTQTQRETPPENTTRKVTARRSTGVNTNLEQISDWLTKILVGVTLVQISEVNGHLAAAAALIADSLGGEEMRSFASALMLYFAVTGFLFSYLLTRLFLQRAFEQDIAARNNG